MLATENHTVNHTSNEEWGFPKHVHAGKPHLGRIAQIDVSYEYDKQVVRNALFIIPLRFENREQKRFMKK